MDFNFYMEDENIKITEDGINILSGKKPLRGKFKSFIDCYGNNVYHYLSLSKDPIYTYSIWKNKIKKENLNHLNNKGLHFIHYLYLNGKESSINYFLQEFKDDLVINNDNLLLLSSIQDDENFIKRLLLEKKDDINFLDPFKNTFLKYITLYHSLDLLKYVLSYGADPNIKDDFGKTSLHYAAEIYNIEKYQLLEEFQALDNIESNFKKRTPFEILEYSIHRNFIEIESVKKRWDNERYKLKSIFSI